MTERSELRLSQTLEDAGFPSSAEDVRILGSSEANPADNSRIHRQTNDLILDLLQEDRLGRCIHITGDARALVDPFHRELCKLIKLRGDDPFHVLYRLPEEKRSDPIAAVEWNLQRWSSKAQMSWREKFLSIDTISSRAVDLVASAHTGEIQFSVFGNRYVQLQAKHKVDAISKPVWLLDSVRLNEHLTERAELMLESAVDVDESWFTRFALKLNGVLATYIMKLVARSPGIDRDGILGNPNVDLTPDDPADVLRVLKAMGLISEGPTGVLETTPSGQDFIMTG